MWNPYYQLVLCNTPIFYPFQPAHIIPVPFPIVQTVSTIPTQTNIRSNEKHLQQIQDDDAMVSSEPIVKEQLDFGGQLPTNSLKQIIKIMQLVLSKIDSDPKLLQEEIFEHFTLAKTVGKQFFTTLISKLKKLSKTKEQIIKYCMRKAFKFVNQKLKDEICKLPEDDILREFIKGVNTGNQNIPFKKNSNFKTMNAHFLSQLFQSPTFVQLYQEFLAMFPKVCEYDNNKKVEHLAKMMLSHIKSKSKDLKRFNNFKRIPWTQSILSRCYSIAQDLQKYASGSIKWGNSLTDQ